MDFRKIESPKRHLLILLFVFIASRLILKLGFGLEFQGGFLTGSWKSMQALDPLLLQTDLLNSIFHLHSQPPLFNLFCGLVLKVFPENNEAAFQVIYWLIGVLQSFLIYLNARKLGVNPTYALGLGIGFMLLPSTILFENLLLYTYPVAFLLLASFYFFLSYLKENNLKHAFLFFLSLAFVVLTRSMFHFGWLIILTGWILYQKWDRRREILLAASIPLLLVGLWYGKNAVLFGKFSASTWMGFSISKMMLPADDAQRQILVDHGICSSAILVKDDSLRLKSYEPWIGKPDTGDLPAIHSITKSTGATNFNHVAYIRLSDLFMQDGVKGLKNDPKIYVKNVFRSMVTLFQPSVNFWQLEGNQKKLGWYDGIVSLNASSFGIKLPASLQAMPILLFYLAIGMFAFLAAFPNKWWKWAPAFSKEQKLITAFLFGNVLYVVLVGSLLDFGENMRFRYQVTPLVCIWAMMLVQQYVPLLSGIRKGRR